MEYVWIVAGDCKITMNAHQEQEMNVTNFHALVHLKVNSFHTDFWKQTLNRYSAAG